MGESKTSIVTLQFIFISVAERFCSPRRLRVSLHKMLKCINGRVARGILGCDAARNGAHGRFLVQIEEKCHALPPSGSSGVYGGIHHLANGKMGCGVLFIYFYQEECSLRSI